MATRGRPPKPIDADKIERAAAIGCTVAEIATVLGVSKDTLERRYMDAIERGRERGRCSLRRMQWRGAKKGNPTMLIWLGKQMLGQKDVIATEHTGADGGPIQTNHTIDLSKLSVDEVRTLHALRSRVFEAPGSN